MFYKIKYIIGAHNEFNLKLILFNNISTQLNNE